MMTTTTTPLSPREYEVALLVAEGLSNREIAERSCLEVQSVRNYVTVIARKLALPVGPRPRAGIVRWVEEREA
jgi:DNA-binding NarL/FixJ family response regulator